MNAVYHLCGYDKATRRLVMEQPVPSRLLTTVQTLIKPAADDPNLVLPYELSTNAVRILAEACGLSIDPTEYHYYFEASDAPAASVDDAVAITAR